MPVAVDYVTQVWRDLGWDALGGDVIRRFCTTLQ
jgi:hypothetical protein